MRTFPFPFRSDSFRYSTNVEPARVPVQTSAGRWGSTIFDNDLDYRADLQRRSQILAAEPTRCVVLPHMRAATWDAMLSVLTELAASQPEQMQLARDGNTFRFCNRLLDVEQSFVFGQDDSLPCSPLHFAGSQVQDDLVLLDQREDVLWADAGLVSFAADWSLAFVIGMKFMDLHAPVPGPVHQANVIGRAHDVLLKLQPGAEIRRTNWIMTVGRHLDMSTEMHQRWAPDRNLVLADAPTAPDLGALLNLRVELQHLIRLPLTGTILFTIRTYHVNLAELASAPPEFERFHRVMTNLDPEIIRAKGMDIYYQQLTDWLRKTSGDAHQ